jgi:hypothetical protein
VTEQVQQAIDFIVFVSCQRADWLGMLVTPEEADVVIASEFGAGDAVFVASLQGIGCAHFGKVVGYLLDAIEIVVVVAITCPYPDFHRRPF